MYGKKMHVIVLLFWGCILAACQVDSGTGAEEAGVSDKYQFVEGAGIFPPGTPVIYQMDLSEPVTVENEYASVTLINAVWQDDVIGLRLSLTDRSAAILTEEEVRLLQESGSGIPNETDGYFCIDIEQKLYGRSEYRKQVDSQVDNPDFIGIVGRLYGKGFPEDTGCLYDRAPSTVSYDEVLESGIIRTETELVMKHAGIPAREPQGTYQLKVAGFEEPLEFEFTKAPEFLSLDQIPGIVERGGSYFLTTGRQARQRLHLLCHIYPGEGKRLLLLDNELSFQAETVSPLYHFSLQYTPLSGLPGNSVTEMIYDIGNISLPAKAELACDGMLLVSQEESEVYTLEIPESVSELDIPVRFADSTLFLTGIENRHAADRDMESPSVYISAASADAGADRQLVMVYALFDEGIDATEEELRRFPYGITYPDREADSIYSGTIKGFSIPYQAEEKQLQVKFREPSYLWEERFVLSVIMNGI